MNSIKYMANQGNFKKRIIFGFFEYFVATLFWLIIDQYLMYSVFDNAIAKNSIRALLFVTIVMILKQLLKLFHSIYHSKLRHHLQRDYSNYIRKDIVNKYIDTNIAYFDNSNSGEMYELVMNDVNTASTLFAQKGLVSFGDLCAKLPFFLIMLFLIDYKLTTILVIIYMIGYTAIIMSNKKGLKLLSEIRDLNISITKWINEQVNNFELIKSNNTEEIRLEKMETLLNEYTVESANINELMLRYNFVYTFCSFLATIATISIGGLDLYSSMLSYGTLMIFINGTSSIKDACDSLVGRLPSLNRAYVSINKIHKFLIEYKPEIETGNVELEEISSIEFRDVCFSYNDGKQVLNNININIDNDDKMAIVGRTGCGKTTLVNLLCRFYETTSGEILINGINIKEYTLESLRKNIGYVMQDVVIFEGNIYDNISYANKDASKEQIEDICKNLKLHDKIMSLPEGYETSLNDNVDLFSQGEKQMINFARIMVENCNVVILDEITSSLSYENEELIKNAMKEIEKSKICIIIAHRLSTIKSCNKIIYMQEGNILENGSHEELINAEGYYYKLVNN